MSTTRQQIVETTSELFERQGYHATGLNQIVAASATPRGSLYYYFPAGKEELGAEAIEFKARQMSEHMRRQLAAYDDPIEAVYRFLLSLADHVEGANCSTGAPIAAVALETAGVSERLRKACAAAYCLLCAPLEEKLQTGGFAEDQAANLALTISAALEGAVILSRTQQDPTPMRIVAEAMQQLLRCCKGIG